MTLSFAHIAPTAYLEQFCAKQDTHLILAHLVESDEKYADWYASNKAANYQRTGQKSQQVHILDNSAFELFTQGKDLFDPEKLISIGSSVQADYIVLPDYPGESSTKTIEAALEYAPKFKEAGFGTFFVPQGRKGVLEDYIAAFAYAASSPLIDYIGVSILGVPNAFDCYLSPLQRYHSRYRMMSILEDRGLLHLASMNGKKIHFLGMLDGPNEIDLVSRFSIDTWDSSAAVWAGLNGIRFDNSPTGLYDGKFTKHVDFSFETDDITAIRNAKDNISVINNMVKESNGEPTQVFDMSNAGLPFATLFTRGPQQ